MKSRSTLRLRVLCLLLLLPLTLAANSGDPHFSQQWGLQRIRVTEAWQASQGEGITVAIVDSGVDLEHPDLVDAFARRPDGRVLGHDFVAGGDDAWDYNGHGTMVAGIVGARSGNGKGVASVAPQVRIMPVRVLDEHAMGTSSVVEEGIRWAVDNGADVINLSLEIARDHTAGPAAAQRAPIPPGQSPDRAVRYAWSKGVAVVAAVGNDSDDFTDYPPDSPVLLVGAVDEQDRRATFSDTGRSDIVMAPGVDVVSTWCNPCGPGGSHTIGQSEGTSYAAPHVAGIVALLRATGMTPAQSVQRVRETAVDLAAPGPDVQTGYGRVDAAAAVGVAPPMGSIDGGVLPPGAPPVAGSAARPREVAPPGSGAEPGSSGMTDAERRQASGRLASDGVGGARQGWILLAAFLVLIDAAALSWTLGRPLRTAPTADPEMAQPSGGGGSLAAATARFRRNRAS